MAYDRAARGEAEGATVALPSAAHGLSFAPALIGLGIVIGVSIAAETAALLWSTLLLRAEAPKLAAIAGLGAAFFAACQATLRFNADVIRLRFSDQRIIVGSFAVAAAGFAVVAAEGGFALSVAGFALIGIGTGAIVPCGFALAARQSGDPAGVGLSSASLFSALTRLPAPLATGAIAQSFSLPVAFAAFALALALRLPPAWPPSRCADRNRDRGKVVGCWGCRAGRSSRKRRWPGLRAAGDSAGN